MNHKTVTTVSVLLAVAAVASSPVSAASYVLTDNGSTARIDADSGAGMYDWVVGNEDQLEKQWFYYRTPNSGAYAQPINAISPSVLNFQSGNTLITTYANSDFSLTISYILNGGTLTANILESIVVKNTSGAPLQFTFFQYSDFDLLGTPNDDTVLFTAYDAVKQTDASSLYNIQEGINNPLAHKLEAGLSGLGGTLDKILNNANYDLNDVFNNSGNVTWAFQWNFEIGWDYETNIGEEQPIFKNKTITLPAVPEPATAAILVMAAGALALRRRGA